MKEKVRVVLLCLAGLGAFSYGVAELVYPPVVRAADGCCQSAHDCDPGIKCCPGTTCTDPYQTGRPRLCQGTCPPNGN